MVLAFTEEQKKEIESRGMTVIEFKRMVYNIVNVINDAWKVLKNSIDKFLKAWRYC